MFDFSRYSSLLLIFFVHGAVFSGLLLRRGIANDERSSRWLALLLFLCCLYIAPFMLGYAGWYAWDGYRELLFYLPLQQLFLIGPVMYFYTRTLLDADYRLRGRQWFHLLPAAGYLLYTLWLYCVDVLIIGEPYYYADGRDRDLDPWYQVAGLISMFTYFSLSLHHYRQYKRMVYQLLSYAEAVLFRWVERFLQAFLIMLILRVLFFILNPEWGQFGSKFWYYFCFSILFYYVSIMGFAHAVRWGSPLLNLPMPTLGTLSAKAAAPMTDPGLEPNADPAEIPDLEDWKERLQHLMQEAELYKNPGLTLLDVAGRLSVTPKQVSQIVNQGFNVNFNDYVNSLRVAALIQQLKAGEHHTRTLLALALDCGFNSKSTFNRAFKKLTGLTPLEYIRKNEL